MLHLEPFLHSRDLSALQNYDSLMIGINRRSKAIVRIIIVVTLDRLQPTKLYCWSQSTTYRLILYPAYSALLSPASQSTIPSAALLRPTSSFDDYEHEHDDSVETKRRGYLDALHRQHQHRKYERAVALENQRHRTQLDSAHSGPEAWQ